MTQADRMQPIPVETDAGVAVPIGDESFAVTLPVFSGPLGLLLHLIDSRQLDVLTVPLADVADAYVEHLASNPVDATALSEFVAIAAQLIFLKSKRMLPAEPLPPLPDGTDEPDEDELRRRLIEYRALREGCGVVSRGDHGVLEDLAVGMPAVGGVGVEGGGELGARYQRNRDNTQWYGNTAATDGSGTHYVFAHLDQHLLSFTGRLDVTMTPGLSLQLYGEPFVSSGRFSNTRELAVRAFNGMLAHIPVLLALAAPAHAIEVVGTQEYRFGDRFLTRFEDAYGRAAADEIAPHLSDLRL